MVEQRQAPRRGRVLGGVRPTSEDHRATTFELFVDLVYVFAVTQVTGYMAAGHSGHGVLQGLLLLTLLWWIWSGYTWLGNQARADEGLLRAGMVVAMAAMFVVALTIPEAWRDAPGGLNGPLVLVGAYLLVRCVRLTLYAVAATGDPGLRHQVTITWLPTVAGAALLVAGALLGGWTQTLLFAGALLVEGVGVYLVSRHGNWRLHSPAHLTERHGLFIILAIGESVVAVGVGAARQPISAPLLVAAILGVAAAVCLWWLYFDMVSLAAEQRLLEARGQARVDLAVEAYTYGHFPIVAGIVLAALASRACWRMPVTASRWAPSTRSLGPVYRGVADRRQRAGAGLRHRPLDSPAGHPRPRGDRARRRAGGAGPGPPRVRGCRSSSSRSRVSTVRPPARISQK